MLKPVSDDPVATAHARLASFENAMRVATNLAEETSEDQLVVATGEVTQPFRVIRAEDIQPGRRWCGTRIHMVRAQINRAA